MAESVGAAASIASAVEWPREGSHASTLHLCGSLNGKAVLIVASEQGSEWPVLREAKTAGALVTAFCPSERAREARCAGADAVLDQGWQDPGWYPGAWAVIYDPGGRLGYARAARSLDRGGVYLTRSTRPGDAVRDLVARITGAARLLQLAD